MADAMMKPLGEANGVQWYWAEPGQFDSPGVYYWDGGRNVLCVPYLAAPTEASKPVQAEAPTASNERELEQALKERDDVEDMADQLAAQIAAITGADIGEHTSANDPWRNAMLAADEWIAEDLRRMFDGRPEQPRPPAGSLAAQAIWLADNAPPSTSKELIESWQVNIIETLHKCAAALATQQEAQPQVEPAGGDKEDALRYAEQSMAAMRDALMPSFEYVGVSLRVSQEDHAAIRSALAGLSTALHMVRAARAAQQATGERDHG